MAYEGFTSETESFFWDLKFNNERPWFQAHKEQFECCLNRPMKALAEETAERFLPNHPDCNLELHVSRIYRDARRLYGHGPYKDNLWFTFKNRQTGPEGACFFFEISARGCCYGFGFWSMRPELLEKYRESIDANPARFLRLIDKIKRLKGFTVQGESYKRKKKEWDGPIDAWYNLKWFNLVHEENYGELLASPDFPKHLAEEFERLMPLYDYFAPLEAMLVNPQKTAESIDSLLTLMD